MSLWQRMKDWFGREGQQLTVVDIQDPADPAVVPNDAYIRVWLTDMFLARERDWFKDRYPAVHASIRLRYAGSEATDFTASARPPAGMLGPGVRTDYALTPLIPYSGGLVEFEAGLTALEGPSAVAAALDVLQDMSKLIGPPLADALGIASTVTNGIERLLDSGSADILLGLHRELASAGGGGDNILRAGYRGVVKAPHGTLDPTQLTVVDSRLHHRGAPLEGHEYMLFRIESRKERDDWRLKDIFDLVKRAKNALPDNETSYKTFGNAAINKALTSADLTQHDAQKVAQAIKAELEAAKGLGLGARGEAERSLADIVDTHAPSRVEPMTIDDLLLT